MRRKGIEKKPIPREKNEFLEGRSAPPVDIRKYFSKEIIGAQGMEEQRRLSWQSVKPRARDVIEKDNEKRRDDSS